MNFENLRLEKGMYREGGKSFTQVLEALDPSENYKGTSLEGTDAFQRQLKRFDIHVKGAYSDPVEKFFHTMESSVLFPEYISRAVKTGMEEDSILPKIVATTTNVDSMDYRSVYSDVDDKDKSLSDLTEGAAIPTTKVKTKENLIKLQKRGRMLVASYEAIRFQKLDLFSVTLRQIGAYINSMHLADAVKVLREGDGNNNAAVRLEAGSGFISDGSFNYKQLVEFWAQFGEYNMNTILCNNEKLLQMLSMPELQNSQSPVNFSNSGILATPLGAEIIRTSCVPDGEIVGLDRRYALEMVQAGGVCVEYDKIIDRQLERAAITSITGFGKIADDATKILAV